jgi:hypothetical protein
VLQLATLSPRYGPEARWFHFVKWISIVAETWKWRDALRKSWRRKAKWNYGESRNILRKSSISLPNRVLYSVTVYFYIAKYRINQNIITVNIDVSCDN